MRNSIVAVVMTLFAVTPQVIADVVTFNNDPVAIALGSTFQSVDSSSIIFRSSDNATLSVWTSAEWSLSGNALEHRAGAAIAEELTIDFLGEDASLLRFFFGNDDAGGTLEGNEAVLAAYKDGVQVGESRVVMNRNLRIDQQIEIAGIRFDEAKFWLEGPTISGQLIDNVEFVVAPPIPEPAALSLLLLGPLVMRRTR